MSQPDISSLLEALRADGADPAALITEYLTANPDTDLSKIEDAALDAFNTVYGDGTGDYTDADLAGMRSATGLLDQVREVRTTRETESRQRSEQAAELAGRAQRTDTPEAPDAGTESGQPASDAEDAATTAHTPEPVAASHAPARRTRSDFARLADNAGGASPWSVTAAADIPGVPAGAVLDGIDGLTEAVTSRLSAFRKLGPGVKTSVGIAKLSLTRDSSLVASGGDDQYHRRLVDQAANEKRLEGNSLTAAGMWCAPSETVYDLCPDLATTTGLVDVPSITVSRGGIRYPQSPDYAEVYSTLQGGVWEWTNAKSLADANTPKPCTSIPCPEFDECRLDAYGLCIQTDILQNHAWPELTRDWTQRLLTAQTHLVNSKILAKMIAGSTTVAFGTGTDPFQDGGTQTILDILELQAVYVRTSFRMSDTATLEVVLPTWTRALIRADLAKRQGVDLVSVPNSRIDSFFRDRFLNVQFVYDFADIDVTGPPTAWPTTVPVLMYPAGTWVAARQDVVELSGIYDSTQLANNQFTGLFSEEAICVIQRCYTSLYLTINVCADGVTSLPAAPDCSALV